MTNKVARSSEEVLLLEINDIINTIPASGIIAQEKASNFEWLGRASAAVTQWDAFKAIEFKIARDKLGSALIPSVTQGYRALVTILYEAQSDLRMRQNEPLSFVAEHGMVFDFFEAVRKIIEQAKEDILFVDPYITTDFVSRFLPQLGNTVNIRLLTGNKNDEQKKKLSTLIPSLELYTQQTKKHVELRSGNFHDRYIFIDGKQCYLCSQSFKDGRKTAPVMMTQIIDTVSQVVQIHESMWDAATHEYPLKP